MTSRKIQDAKIGLYDMVTSTTLASNKSPMSMRFFMLTCTVGLLSWGGTCDGISVYYHQKPRPGHPRRASKICDTPVLFSRTPRRMHSAWFKVTPAGAQRGHREDPG